MRARDIMTRPVISVQPATALREVVETLLQHRISGVPVVDHGKVLGFVGEGELVHRHEIGTDAPPDLRHWWQRWFLNDPAPAAYVRAHGSHARDVMTTEVVSVDEDAPLARLAEIFERRQIRRVPVLRAGAMVGLVTRSDLLRALAQRAPAPVAAAPLDDAQILERLQAELARQRWWTSSWSNVHVVDGVVHFVGYVQGPADREAARIAAENIPGVRAVKDERALQSELQPML